MLFDQQNKEWLLALSFVYIQTGRLDHAVTILTLLLSECPGLPDALKLAGNLYFLKEEYDRSFNYINQWMKIRSTRRDEKIEMSLLQARVLLKLKRKDLARKCLMRYKVLLDEEELEQKLFVEQEKARQDNR